MRHFKFQPSRYLASLLVAVHSAALVALLPLALPIWMRAILLVLLAFSLRYYLRRYAWLQMPSACIGLMLDADGVKLLVRNGAQLPCEISYDSLVMPYLTVLNVVEQASRRAHSIVILPDSMEADAFRQLRVWLKWGRSSGNVAGRREHSGRR